MENISLDLYNLLSSLDVLIEYFIKSHEFLYIFSPDEDKLNLIREKIFANSNVDYKGISFIANENTFNKIIPMGNNVYRLELINFKNDLEEIDMNNLSLVLYRLSNDIEEPIWSSNEIIDSENLNQIMMTYNVALYKRSVILSKYAPSPEGFILDRIPSIFRDYIEDENVFLKVMFYNKTILNCSITQINNIEFEYNDALNRENLTIVYVDNN